ncbi:MAG TPA: hypothetical protein VI299_21055 [Polyangiales bacterium]
MSGWTFLRGLLPSWRFFDAVAAPLALWVEHEGSFRELTFAHEYGLFVNPRGNVTLLLYSTLERLLSELADDPAQPEHLVSYALVQNLAAAQLDAGAAYRFEIRAAEQVLLRSPTHHKGAP